eukprot:g6338.t1
MVDFESESVENWTQFLDQPGDLFADLPSLDTDPVAVSTAWEECLAEPLLYEDGLSWDPSDFLQTTRTPSSSGSTDESSKTVLLSAKDFVFSKGDETLADRVCSLPALPTVTTGERRQERRSLESDLKDYVEYRNRKLASVGATEHPVKTTKRKQPEIDLDSITDPEERKKQRRMAKNRRTAAVSRLRQKARLENLETQIQDLMEENQKLKSLLTHFVPIEDLQKKEETFSPHSDELAVLLTDFYLLAILQSIAVQKAPWILVKILFISVTINFTHSSPVLGVLTVKETHPSNRYVAGLQIRSGVS